MTIQKIDHPKTIDFSQARRLNTELRQDLSGRRMVLPPEVTATREDTLETVLVKFSDQNRMMLDMLDAYKKEAV